MLFSIVLLLSARIQRVKLQLFCEICKKMGDNLSNISILKGN